MRLLCDNFEDEIDVHKQKSKNQHKTVMIIYAAEESFFHFIKDQAGFDLVY